MILQRLKKHRQFWKDAGVAFSLVNLCLIQACLELLYEGNKQYYAHRLLNNTMLLALAANMLLWTAVAWALARWLRRSTHPALHCVAHLTLCGLLLIPLNFVRVNVGVYFFSFAEWPGVMKMLLVGLVLAVPLGALWWHRHAARLTAGLLLILLPMAIWNFGKLWIMVLTPKPVFAAQGPAPPVVKHGPGEVPRVLWLVFDGLDQRMGFSERPVGIQLPEFDRLRQESIYATNALMPGTRTLLSIPALTLGRFVIDASPASPGELNVTFAGTTNPVHWTVQSNVFSDLRALGRNFAVVGWYHPYPRLFGHLANVSLMYGSVFLDAVRGGGFFENMAQQVGIIAHPLFIRWQRLRRFHQALADVGSLVSNPDMDLVYWHAPVPHRPGIYDHLAHKLAFRVDAVSSYLGNQALADQTLGLLRRELEQAGLWDRTWLIVSSDHCWIEAAGYFGCMDYRVPFLVKPPGINPPLTCGAKFSTILTRDLILAIQRKEVTSAPEALAWLNTHPTPSPPYEQMTAP